MISKKSSSSVFHEILNQTNYKEEEARRRLINSTKDSLEYVQRLDLQTELNVHSGCVNTITWNKRGEYILSGADDQHITVTNPFTGEVLVKYKTLHKSNIFSAKFLPQSNDHGIVSCSGDGMVIHTELTTIGTKGIFGCEKTEMSQRYFNCHNNGTTYEVLTVPTEPKTFMSCGEDGTVRLFDLRLISNCHKTYCKDNILIFSPSATTAMCLAPISHYYLAVGSSDSLIKIYDRRYLSLVDFSSLPSTTIVTSFVGGKYTVPIKAFQIPTHTKRNYRVTSVQYSNDESDLLVSYSSDYLYLFDATKDGVSLETKRDKKVNKKSFLDSSPPPVRKLRLRGDWSDTGPNARPERDITGRVEIGQVRPQLHGTIMHRMTEVLSRMLNDPQTRSGLSGHAPDISQDNHALFDSAAREIENFNNRDDPQPGPSGLNNTRNNDEKSCDENMDVDEECSENNLSKIDDQTALKNELEKIEIDTKECIFNYMKMKYEGHRNARTMIKEANFWGNDYVMSGSDCGFVFIWNRHNGKLVKLLQADQHVVNCVQQHPELPILATSGIDYNIKIWAPIRDQGFFDEAAANDLMARNAIMLEETKDTITVPAAFMIRMLACIHSLRSRNRINEQNNSQNSNTNNNSNNNDDNNSNNNGDNNSSSNNNNSNTN